MSKKESWKHHLRAQERSGMSQAAYCRKHGLDKKQYYYWKRRFREEAGKGECFVPVGNSLSIELQVGEITVRVPSGFDSEELKRVVEALC
jgi:transposase-like protein